MSRLTQIYEDIKAEINRNTSQASNLINVQSVGNLQNSPGALAWRNQAAREVEKLSDGCCKKVLTDIYCKIIPLDTDFVAGNQGQMKQDVDDFLASKNMTATQYFKSCHEKTKAPLLEFILRSCQNIGKQFMEEADKTLKDAQKNNIDVPPPVADADNEDISNQIVDITGNDMEYDTFIQVLKKKTIDKIVSSISNIISDTKDNKDMEFNPKPRVEPSMESAISIIVEHIHKKLWKENMEITSNLNEQIIGLAIREATLNQIDLCFRQPDSEFIPFRSKIRFGKGALVTESAIRGLVENMQ